MNSPMHHRKGEPFDYEPDKLSLTSSQERQRSYSTADWVGSLKFFSLYSYLFLFYVMPISYVLNINGCNKLIKIVVMYFILGSLLSSFLSLFSKSKNPLLIKKRFIASELIIILIFVFYSFSIYIFPYAHVHSFLWFMLGLTSTYHEHLEQRFIAKISHCKTIKEKEVVESSEIISQICFYFLLVFFLSVLFPFLISSLFSFFFYSQDNFNTFLPLTFGNLILTFLSIYHWVLMQLDPSVKNTVQVKKTKKIPKFSIFRRNLEGRLESFISKLQNPYFLFRSATYPYLFLLNFYFIYYQKNNSYVNILLNVSLFSSVALILKTYIFFYLPSYLAKFNWKKMNFLAIFLYLLLLILQTYNLLGAKFDFYIFFFIFIGLRFLTDFICVSSVYAKKNCQGKIKLTTHLLNSYLPPTSSSTMLIWLVYVMAYFEYHEATIYCLSLCLCLLALYFSYKKANRQLINPERHTATD